MDAEVQAAIDQLKAELAATKAQLAAAPPAPGTNWLAGLWHKAVAWVLALATHRGFLACMIGAAFVAGVVFGAEVRGWLASFHASKP